MRLFPKSNIAVRKSIVRLHNMYRASVVPPASNMLRMVTTIAQWANSGGHGYQ